MALQEHGLTAEDLYRFCYTDPMGVTEEEIRRQGWKNKAQLVSQVNKLMTQGLMKLIPIGPEGSRQFKYQAVDFNLAKKVQGLDDEHMLVLQKIEDTASQGAWSKTLQNQTKLSAPVINKVTKELLKRGLIKEVKSAQFRNRKVFMKYDVEPAEQVSGGRWYHNGDWDTELVEWMTALCREKMDMCSRAPVNLREIHSHLMQHPGPRRSSPLSIEHVADIMRSLELDDEVVSICEHGERFYCVKPGQDFDIFAARLPTRVKRKRDEDREDDELAPGGGGIRVPCVSCQLREQCRVGGLICPEKCEYMTAWLTSDLAATDDW
jgi:DNA-directed RNA polymerase III subunit RPC6